MVRLLFVGLALGVFSCVADDDGRSDAEAAYARCASDAECPTTNPLCLLPSSLPGGMCSRACVEDIHCRSGSHCMDAMGDELDDRCFPACESTTCPAGTSCVDWDRDLNPQLICVPDDWLAGG